MNFLLFFRLFCFEKFASVPVVTVRKNTSHNPFVVPVCSNLFRRFATQSAEGGTMNGVQVRLKPVLQYTSVELLLFVSQGFDRIHSGGSDRGIKSENDSDRDGNKESQRN